MAKFVLTDVSVVLTVGSTDYDLSDHIESATIESKKDAPEVTAMGDGWRMHMGGLKNWTAQFTAQNDFAAGSIDAAIYAAFEADSATLTVKPTSGEVSDENPSFTGTVICTGYTPLSGNYGDVSKQSPQLQGTGALVRATS